MDSKNITMTNHRLIQAIQKGNKLAGTQNTKDLIKNAQDEVKLRVAKLLKFYPGSDKAVVQFLDDNKTSRCVLGHNAIGNEINVSYTPQGTPVLDAKYNEICIPLVNPIYCVVLDISEKDNKTEQCIISYISLDNTEIIRNADPGEYKIQVLDSSIRINNTGVYIEAPTIKFNDEIITTNDTDSGYVTIDELNTSLTALKTEILEELRGTEE